MITFKAKTASGEIINSALSPFNFPAGEAHIKREDQRELETTEIAIIQPTPESIHNDLFALAMWNDYVIHDGWEEEEAASIPKRVLVLPYVPGARADRGLPFGLGIYAEFINNLKLDQVIIFDPHSPVAERELFNTTIVYSDELFDQVTMRAVLHQYNGIIAPDKGAAVRAKAVADITGLPVFTATKTRDEATGKLSGFSIEGLNPDDIYLIIDDICDRGGTFKGLFKASGLGKGQVDLFVSHGVFSSDALETLPEVFQYVYTTNSYAPLRDLSDESGYSDTFRRFDVIRLLLSKIK